MEGRKEVTDTHLIRHARMVHELQERFRKKLGSMGATACLEQSL